MSIHVCVVRTQRVDKPRNGHAVFVRMLILLHVVSHHAIIKFRVKESWKPGGYWVAWRRTWITIAVVCQWTGKRAIKPPPRTPLRTILYEIPGDSHVSSWMKEQILDGAFLGITGRSPDQMDSFVCISIKHSCSFHNKTTPYWRMHFLFGKRWFQKPHP